MSDPFKRLMTVNRSRLGAAENSKLESTRLGERVLVAVPFVAVKSYVAVAR